MVGVGWLKHGFRCHLRIDPKPTPKHPKPPPTFVQCLDCPKPALDPPSTDPKLAANLAQTQPKPT